jgi:hypothetical protein
VRFTKQLHIFDVRWSVGCVGVVCRRCDLLSTSIYWMCGGVYVVLAWFVVRAVY